MTDALRARASLLIVGLFAFLLILWSVPRWDSGWVQAVGSIAAILSGFAYVALQQRWQRQAQRAREREFRLHVHDLCRTVEGEVSKRIAFAETAAAGHFNLKVHSFRDTLDIISDEMLTVSPSDCASAKYSIAAREVGFFAKAFAHVANEAANRPGPFPGAALSTLREHRDAISQSARNMERCAVSFGDPITLTENLD